MADKAQSQFSEAMKALFQGMDSFVTSKTVVGEPVRVDSHTVIIPLIDVSCGMAAGTFARTSKNHEAGGLSAKMTPSSLLIVQDGNTRLISIKHQDAMSKIVDMVPDMVNRITGRKQVTEEAVEQAEALAKEIADEQNKERQNKERQNKENDQGEK